MDHQDHLSLLRPGIPERGGVWAELGSGRGAFTLALAELVGPNGIIYSLDKDRGALQQQAQALPARYPAVTVYYQVADFNKALALPPLDGLLMANSLHFVRHKETLVRKLREHLRPAGRFLIVEYDTDRGNMWVPHPLSYETWKELARRCGFTHTERLATVPSRFLGQIFSAASR
jgi:ubiquinone/menaquinone biosynthesis C-methylase UbiE